MLVLLTLFKAVLGSNCDLPKHGAPGATKKDPVIYEIAASASGGDTDFTITDDKHFGFWPNYELTTGPKYKFSNKNFKAVSITAVDGDAEALMEHLKVLLVNSVQDKMWGYYFKSADQSATRVVVVFKPLKSEDYTAVLDVMPGNVDVWSVEKYSDVQRTWGLPNHTEPLWVMAKSKSKAQLRSCTNAASRQEKDDAKDEEDIKETKMYKKFSEMTKKKLMKLMEKYKTKIAIAKKALKAKKEN